MTEEATIAMPATTADADRSAASPAAPRFSVSLLGIAWIGVAVIPMGIVACGAIMAAINERWVGAIVVGGQWLWAVVLACAVIATLVRLARNAIRRS